MKHLLVLRFSALGDVAMAVPVVSSLLRQNPGLRVTVVSRPFAAPLFAPLGERVDFFGADLKGEHRGLPGLYRLARQLKARGIDAVADLHDVLRTKVLRMLFRCMGVRTAHINKGRREKRELVAGCRRQLRTSVERYADVFRELGFACAPDFRALPADTACLAAKGIPEKAAGEVWAGIAPFAAHAGKIYPPELMEEVVRSFFARRPAARVFVFCSGKEAEGVAGRWEEAFPRLLFACRKLRGLQEELALMSRLDAMVSMDSANMHLASLVAVPVVSIWGATHPFAGFLGYGQRPEDAVQLPLECRPCSIYGSKPCRFGDYRCLRGIPPARVLEAVEKVLAREREKRI